LENSGYLTQEKQILFINYSSIVIFEDKSILINDYEMEGSKPTQLYSIGFF